MTSLASLFLALEQAERSKAQFKAAEMLSIKISLALGPVTTSLHASPFKPCTCLHLPFLESICEGESLLALYKVLVKRKTCLRNLSAPLPYATTLLCNHYRPLRVRVRK